jgi:hypothetical protein
MKTSWSEAKQPPLPNTAAFSTNHTKHQKDERGVPFAKLSRSDLTILGMVIKVIIQKRCDEVIAVVVARLHTQRQRVACGLARGGVKFKMNLNPGSTGQ